jgi:hypothetical protein
MIRSVNYDPKYRRLVFWRKRTDDFGGTYNEGTHFPPLRYSLRYLYKHYVWRFIHPKRYRSEFAQFLGLFAQREGYSEQQADRIVTEYKRAHNLV